MDQATNLRNLLKDESESLIRLRKDDRHRQIAVSEAGPRVMAVTSGKGGVGKTNIVANLGIALQRMGRRVLILDADLGLANIDILYGLHPDHTIDSVIRGERELAQIIVEGPEGVSLIPSSSGIQDLAHLSEGQKINLLNEFDLLSTRYDVLLIDTGAGISSNVIYFNLAALERLVVVTPEPTSITDAYALIKILFQHYDIKHFILLMNMVKSQKTARAVFDHLSRVIERFLTGISLDFAGYIPLDDHLKRAVSLRSPVVVSEPGAPSSCGFARLAEMLLNQDGGGRLDGNIKFFWKRLLAEANR